MTLKGLTEIRQRYILNNWKYKRVFWKDFEYSILENCIYHTSRSKNDRTYNDITIMFDTETSKHDDSNYIDYAPEYDDILASVRASKLKWHQSYIDVCSKSSFKIAGMKFKGKRSVDSLYQELSEKYPYIFKGVENDIDAASEIYEYITGNVKEPPCIHNHVVIWTLSINLFDLNICTLYGRKPSDLCQCMLMIQKHLTGHNTSFYCHNLSYDHCFLRKFFNKYFGVPKRQLNVKPHYPISIEFDNGIIIKDSLILAQQSLASWAKNMNVEHKKASGDWDYNVIRHQNTPLTADELHYAEYDTLAGVECIDALKNQLDKHMGTMPLTATGITREIIRREGRKNKARKWFLKCAPTFKQYEKLLKVYHGGYTHGNRHYLDVIIDKTFEGVISDESGAIVKGFDFASSYPYSLFKKYPVKFIPIEPCSVNYIVEHSEEYAFMFKLVGINVQIKDDAIQMPFLQKSKCEKTINALVDNGRIIASNYIEIYLNEIDLRILEKQYTFGQSCCYEVEASRKEYLPKWFTDVVFDFFRQKTLLKGDESLKVAYNVAKIILNSCYGLCCQRLDKFEIVEDIDTGQYIELDPEKLTTEQKLKYADKIKTREEIYNETIAKRSTILPYFIGCWCTSYSAEALFKMGDMCETWLYSDTDSCYGINWDYDAINAYNQSCIDFMCERGYGGVEHNGKTYYLGVAENEPETNYYSFSYQGAKRYAGVCCADRRIHITVAGVPKELGSKCVRRAIKPSETLRYRNIRHAHFKAVKAKIKRQKLMIEDLTLFTEGFVFDGDTTGKLTHTHNYIDKIYINEFGDEVGDSIDLTPCDYKLDTTEYHSIFEYLYQDNIYMTIAEDCSDRELII